MQDKLNTMDSFENEGFKIERNGQVITLTKDEMSDFRFCDKANNGRCYLENYEETAKNIVEENREIIQKMKQDEIICYELVEDLEDEVYTDYFYVTMSGIIQEAIGRVKKSLECNRKE